MSNELPGEWGIRLGPKGIHSYRDLAAAVGDGVSQGTMHRLINGKATSAETVNKVADAVFDGDRDLVWRLRGSKRRDYGDWSLPADASLLTEEQRDAVLAVIRAMVPAEQEELMGNADQHPAAKNPPPDEGGGSVTKLTPRPSAPTPSGVKRAARRTGKGTAEQRGEGPDKTNLE